LLLSDSCHNPHFTLLSFSLSRSLSLHLIIPLIPSIVIAVLGSVSVQAQSYDSDLGYWPEEVRKERKTPIRVELVDLHSIKSSSTCILGSYVSFVYTYLPTLSSLIPLSPILSFTSHQPDCFDTPPPADRKLWEAKIHTGPASSKKQRLAAANRALSTGSCTYDDVCCENPSTNECVLMGHPPVGHDDVVMDHCPSAGEGASGLFSDMIDESTSRFNSCCKEQAASVEWTYSTGTSTGADEDGNTGCQRNNSCNYGEQTCCYNTWGDHKCYIYHGLPERDGDYGQTNVGCPAPVGDTGWVYRVDESDGRNNHCCEDMMDSTPVTFRGAAIDGNLCWLNVDHETRLSDCSTYTGKWIGFMEDDTSDDVLVYTSLTQAEEAGCHIGDYEEKVTPECKAELELLAKSGSSRNTVTLAATIGATAASLMAYA
jgi:hypothetical protein